MSDAPVTDVERIERLRALKDFAVQRGYSVPEKLLKDIAEVEHKLLRTAEGKPASMTSEQISNVDRLTIELSQITYPVTTSNVARVSPNSGVTRFVYVMLAFGLLAALGAGYASSVVRHNDYGADIAQAVLPLALGFVGAIVYVMLPNGRLNVVAGLDAENKATDIVRVVMGGLLGFVLLYAARPVSVQGSSNSVSSQHVDAWMLFIPLIGGYSVSLVVGILAKAVAAVQLALNIDEKSVRASLQK